MRSAQSDNIPGNVGYVTWETKANNTHNDAFYIDMDRSSNKLSINILRIVIGCVLCSFSFLCLITFLTQFINKIM